MVSNQVRLMLLFLILMVFLAPLKKVSAGPSEMYIQLGFYGYENVMFNYGDVSLVSNFGEFQVNFDGDNSQAFRAFFLDFEPLAYGTNPIIDMTTPDLYNPGNGQYAEWLMRRNSIGGNPILGAALQLAISEVSYDLDTSLGVGSNYNLDYGNGYWGSFGGWVYTDTGLFSYDRILVDASFNVVADADRIKLINGWYDAYIRDLVNFLDAGNTYASDGEVSVVVLSDDRASFLVDYPVPETVPVPGSVVLMGCGLIFIALWNRKDRGGV